MTEETNEKIEIVSVEEGQNPFMDLIRNITDAVTPIVAESVKVYAEKNPGDIGPVTDDKCVHCGKNVKGVYSELNVPINSNRLSFDRYVLCAECTDKILKQL